jgi:hypothetical protein
MRGESQVSLLHGGANSWDNKAIVVDAFLEVPEFSDFHIVSFSGNNSDRCVDVFSNQNIKVNFVIINSFNVVFAGNDSGKGNLSSVVSVLGKAS